MSEEDRSKVHNDWNKWGIEILCQTIPTLQEKDGLPTGSLEQIFEYLTSLGRVD
jgi:hypothetical protein